MISIVIPVYNSADCLPELVWQIRQHVPVDYALILVNDQSRDNSWEVIRAQAREDAAIVGVNMRKNVGQDNAIMAGLRLAQGEYIVIMDDDLQHAPSDIMRLHAACRPDYDVCFGKYLEFRQNWWKVLGSHFNGLAATLFLGKPRHIYLSPFKIMHRDLVQDIIAYEGPFPYIDGLILSHTTRITQIQVEHQKRFAGRSAYSLLKSIA
ncbi:MAG: glycosyltransferase family 2 protein, partial [Magnetococcales bacterium]|nr:glycosyltransferase family 2 protein [Magnetococcales bacterium]